MKNNLVLVVKYVAKEDKIDLLKSELVKVAELIRQEEGCVQFELLEDMRNPAAFTIYENWESKELWQNHLSSEHMGAFSFATRNALADVSVDNLKFVEA